MPSTVKTVGRYCFYNCGHLHEELEVEYFINTLMSGQGVESGGQAVNRQAQQNCFALDKMIIAHLAFPEFYEEGVENTPARILETHVHGSGILYRNCFQGRRFDFAQYDVLFPHAKAQESGDLLAKMALGRLRFPQGLTEKARQQYEIYVTEHAGEIAKWLLKQHDLESLRWLLALVEQKESYETLLENVLEEASRMHDMETVSFLMEKRRSIRKTGNATRKRLEL